MFDTVKIEFSGEGTFELVPSLKAVELINNAFGNFQNAFASVGAMDFAAIVEVIDAGLSDKIKKSNKGYSKEGLKESIYRKGVMEIMPQAIEFIVLCANGGKKPADDDEADDTKKKIE